MYSINAVDLIDGNEYLVNNESTVENKQDSSVSFDDVFVGQSKSLEEIFQQVSKEYDVPVRLLKAVAQAESAFDTNAVSSCGASGIMQLMPETAKSLGVEDVFDAEQNITGGAKMLAYLLVDYDGNTTLALAAYNAGSGAVAKYGGVPPYKETQNYIKKINEILDGELEADTTNISIEKKNNNTAAIQDTGSGVVTLPVKAAVNTESVTSTDMLFSYEDYLKFLEIYQELLGKLFEFSDDKEGADKKDVLNGMEKSQNQSLYEYQQAIYNPLAVSLLDLK